MCPPAWVRNIVEEEIPNKLSVGKRVRRPDNRLVEITSGQYWGTHGLSNLGPGVKC
jgi:hypothetical protein